MPVHLKHIIKYVCVYYKIAWENKPEDKYPMSYLYVKITYVCSQLRDHINDQNKFITKHSKYRLLFV